MGAFAQSSLRFLFKRQFSTVRSEKEKEEVATVDAELLQMLQKAFEIAVQEDGWARLDLMGSALYQMDPGFDPRTYGHRQLSRLVGNLKDDYEMRTQITDGSTLFYVRQKE